MQHYVIKFVCDLQQVSQWFSPVSYNNKTDRAEILLKVALNTIALTTEYLAFCPSSKMYTNENKRIYGTSNSFTVE
jgi:hypothetical protein